MPHSFGYRARTRQLFSKPFRRHGPVPLNRYLSTYKRGDYVDVKVDGSIQKGMPHKFYTGKTGVVWNVTPRAVGVEVNKVVGNKVLKKRIHVRVEHVRKSRCREDFLERVRANASKGTFIKRQPAAPRPGMLVKRADHKIEELKPLKYELLL